MTPMLLLLFACSTATSQVPPSIPVLRVDPGQVVETVLLGDTCHGIPEGQPQTSGQVADRLTTRGLGVVRHRLAPHACPECRECKDIVAELVIGEADRDRFAALVDELGLQRPHSERRIAVPAK
ncbi:MAG: hypothetical protein H6737_21825 [Alphaproteobacteria bacterium]|nr:hypothetical protein [Alphaproteobacteria bacterium]MCB9700188.1 hypothetical protein [Alphaproteobacteria bacterium]